MYVYNDGSLAPAHLPMSGKFYVGPCGNFASLSWLVKGPIHTSIQIMGFGSKLWDFQGVGPVDKKVSFHACMHVCGCHTRPAAMYACVFVSLSVYCGCHAWPVPWSTSSLTWTTSAFGTRSLSTQPGTFIHRCQLLFGLTAFTVK